MFSTSVLPQAGNMGGQLSFFKMSKPAPVYIPSRFVRGFPLRRKKASAKKSSKEQAAEDPIVHRRDVDFITSLFVVEQLEYESSDDSSTSDESDASESQQGMAKPKQKSKKQRGLRSAVEEL